MTAEALMEPVTAEVDAFELPYRSFAEQVKSLRQKLSLTQEQFAQRFGIPLANVRNWEQPARGTRPDTAARLLISMIKEDAEGVASLIRKVSEKEKGRLGASAQIEAA
jgi:putative transcriptional regulator